MSGARDVERRASVRVPCSTSNVGGGFDCIGIALNRYLEADAWLEPGGGAPAIERAGELAALDADGVEAADDLIMRGVRLACSVRGLPLPRGLRIHASSEIPVARGLGSSAAALVAGALLADRLLELRLGPMGVTQVCATAEGHPDNVGPIMYGGVVLGVPLERGFSFAKLNVHMDVAFVLAIPAFPTSTRTMREALPAQVPFETSVRAAAKGAALVHGLSEGDERLLTFALDDVVHVPYRRALVPGYDAVERAAIRAGAWGATLSGAGSSMLALAPKDRAVEVSAAMVDAWRGVGVEAEPWWATIAAGARAFIRK